jgi:hypothetical protein
VASVDLKEALRLVEQLGIAPIARLESTRPKAIREWAAWHRRLREVQQLAAAKLEEHGAHVAWGDGAHFRFAGYRASSTMGLRAALLNWRKRVELELARRERAQQAERA